MGDRVRTEAREVSVPLAGSGTRWRRLACVALWTTLLVISAAFFVAASVWVLTVPKIGPDFGGFYAAARVLVLSPQTANVYDRAQLAHGFPYDAICRADPRSMLHDYPYPYAFTPLLAILLEPLTVLPCASAYHLWLLGSLALWLAATGLAAALLYRTTRHPLAIPVGIALVLVSLLAMLAVVLGQIFTLVLVLLLGALWLLPEHPRLAGAVLAFAALLQVLPGLLLAWALLTRQWQVVLGAGCASLAALALFLWRAPASLLPAAAGILHNGSWAVVLPWNDALSRVPLVGPTLVAGVILVWLVVALRQCMAPLDGYGFTLVTSLLVAPVLQVVYLVWLAPALVVIDGPRRWMLLAWGSALIVLHAANPTGQTFAVWVPLAVLVVWAAVGMAGLVQAGRS